jgi:hypothetical protein
MRAFVKGICFAALAAFALGTTACGKEATCESAAGHIFDMGMKDAEKKIKDMPDGEEKKMAQKMMEEMKKDGKKKMTEEFVKECKEKKYSKDCLSCINGAKSEEEFEKNCEKKCEGEKKEEEKK